MMHWLHWLTEWPGWKVNLIELITKVDSILAPHLLPRASGNLVNCPTRWSLLFIFGFLCWSSSWWWWPHIGGGKKFRPLLRAGLTVLVQFFCKMYILWVSRSRKIFLADFFWVLPPQTRRFFPKGAKMSEWGAGPFLWAAPFSDIFFPPPIGGHHPVPCLGTQISERDMVHQCTRWWGEGRMNSNLGWKARFLLQAAQIDQRGIFEYFPDQLKNALCEYWVVHSWSQTTSWPGFDDSKCFRSLSLGIGTYFDVDETAVWWMIIQFWTSTDIFGTSGQ